MKKVLVTGGSGFIGGYVCEELVRHGYEPIIFDHQKRDPEDYPVSCEIFLGDINDPVAVTEAIAHADGWIHLAACLGTQETIQNPLPAARTNLLGGLNILQAAAQYNVPGTYIAVGNWWMNNPYSITKNMIERFVEMYNKDRGTKINIVRAVNAYGPRQLAAAPFGPGKVRKITPSFVCRALSGMPIELYGGGSQISDMVYVGDVAKALVLALEHAAAGKLVPTIEIGPADHRTVRDVAVVVKELAGSQSELVDLPMRPGENEGDQVIANYKSLYKIGIDPQSLVPLEDGMELTVDYFRNTKGVAWHEPEGEVGHMYGVGDKKVVM